MQKRERGLAAYASANDFLGRVSSGKVQATTFQQNSNPTAIIAITVIASVITLTTVGAFFLVRRFKKHD